MRQQTNFLVAVLFFVAFIGTLPAFSQGYHIEVELENAGSSPLILGNFFGESTYARDTASHSGNTFVFSGKEPLTEGIYFIAQDQNRIFDVLVYGDQTFSVKTSGPEYMKNLTTSGSDENSLFINEMKFNVARNEEATPFLKTLKDSTASRQETEIARAALEAIDRKVEEYQTEILKRHPDTFVARIIRAQKKITLPEEQEKKDPQRAVQYYKAHYWDNFDLSDPILIRLNTPLYKQKVENYLDRLNIQQPDSINKAVDMLADKASGNQETYKYMMWLLTLKYQQPTIMGLDAVFVHIYDTYFATGKMDYWANEQLLDNLKDYASMLRGSLIGQKAPPLVMPDADNHWHKLYDMHNKYTVIYFFDPDCHHCKIATPKLNKIYNSKEFDLGIYAVSADTSIVKMRDYARDMDIKAWTMVNGPRIAGGTPYYQLYDAMTTPTVYVLDEQKKIIAKKLPVDKLAEFLERYEGLKVHQ